ncbi:MAG: hypothetical protein J7J17_03175, partial [Hadesarchaea archaeon]|nr:hypothetical protein [Hadesarchaea archaeon]
MNSITRIKADATDGFYGHFAPERICAFGPVPQFLSVSCDADHRPFTLAPHTCISVPEAYAISTGIVIF